MTNLRVLGRVRLSRVNEGTTSPERQREVIQQWADVNGHQVIGWAEDLDVSGGVDPFKAPELGPWLTDPDRLAQWDVLAAYRLDRIARRVIPLNRLFGECLESGRSVVSVTENLDLSHWVGRMVANVIAGVAEGELEAITERNTAATRHNLTAGKFRGGNPPLGYKPMRLDQATADRLAAAGVPTALPGEWRYVPDEVMAPLAREIIARVIEGESLSSIVKSLNDNGVVTPQDHHRAGGGKGYRVDKTTGEPRPGRWAVSNLARQLESETLLGYAMGSERVLDAKGNPEKDANGRFKYTSKVVLRNPDGSPILRSEPIIDRATFDRLQVALGTRKGPTPKRRTNPASLLLQVVFCGVCDRPMYRMMHNTTRKRKDGTTAPHHRDYYRCSSLVYTKESCGNRSANTNRAETLVTDTLLAVLGDARRAVRVYEPGEDNSAELADIDAQLADIAGTIGSPGFTLGTPGRAALDARMAALGARRETLAAVVTRPAGYRWVPTGETIGQWWAQQDTEAKNAWLREYDVRLVYTAAPAPGESVWGLTLGDVPAMLASGNSELAEKLRGIDVAALRQAMGADPVTGELSH